MSVSTQRATGAPQSSRRSRTSKSSTMDPTISKENRTQKFLRSLDRFLDKSRGSLNTKPIETIAETVTSHFEKKNPELADAFKTIAEEWVARNRPASTANAKNSDDLAKSRDASRMAHWKKVRDAEDAWRSLTGATLDDERRVVTVPDHRTATGRPVCGTFDEEVQTDSILFDEHMFRGPGEGDDKYTGASGTSGMSIAEIEYRSREGLSERKGGYSRDQRGKSAVFPEHIRKMAREGATALELVTSMYGSDAHVRTTDHPLECFARVAKSLRNEDLTTQEKTLAQHELKIMEDSGYTTVNDFTTKFETLSACFTLEEAHRKGIAEEWALEFLKAEEQNTRVMFLKDQLTSLQSLYSLKPTEKKSERDIEAGYWLRGLADGKGPLGSSAMQHRLTKPSDLTPETLLKMKGLGLAEDTNFKTIDVMATIKTKDGPSALRIMGLDAFKSATEFSLLSQMPHWEQLEQKVFSGELDESVMLKWASQKRLFIETNTALVMTDDEQKAWIKEMMSNLPQSVKGCSGKDCTEWCGSHGKSSKRKRGGKKGNWSCETVEKQSQGRIAHEDSDISFVPGFKERGTKEERIGEYSSFGARSGKTSEYQELMTKLGVSYEKLIDMLSGPENGHTTLAGSRPIDFTRQASMIGVEA